MEQDAKIYELFEDGGKISFAEINAIVNPQIKACLLMLYVNGGYVYAGDFLESGKKRKVRIIDGYLSAKEEIIEEIEREK